MFGSALEVMGVMRLGDCVLHVVHMTCRKVGTGLVMRDFFGRVS